MEESTQQDFEVLFEMPATLELKKSQDGQGRRCVRGLATSENEDLDGETLLKSGLDWQPLRDRGHINYDHQRRRIAGGVLPIIIGVPDEVVMKSEGLWVEGTLFDGDPEESEINRLANEMWSMGQSLQKSGRSLAYSIEGKVLLRRGKKLVKTQADMVALTYKPVNPSCTVELFAKSLCCGRCSPDHPQFNPAHKCGNKHEPDTVFQDGLPFLAKALEVAAATTGGHGALLRENLDRGLTRVLYGDKDCGCFDRKNGRFHKGIVGAHGHMTGCLGYGRDDTFRVLKKIVRGAEKSADLAALAKQAGFIRQ